MPLESSCHVSFDGHPSRTVQSVKETGNIFSVTGSKILGFRSKICFYRNCNATKVLIIKIICIQKVFRHCLLIFLDDLYFQKVKINLVHKAVLGKTGFCVAFEIRDGGV